MSQMESTRLCIRDGVNEQGLGLEARGWGKTSCDGHEAGRGAGGVGRGIRREAGSGARRYAAGCRLLGPGHELGHPAGKRFAG